MAKNKINFIYLRLFSLFLFEWYELHDEILFILKVILKFWNKMVKLNMNFSKRIQENVPLFEKKIIQFPLKIYNIGISGLPIPWQRRRSRRLGNCY